MARPQPIQTKRQVSRTVSIPAPTGGLNARDALAKMPVTDAVIMNNWFPTPTSVDLRNGSVDHVTGITGWVETIAHYSSPTERKLFAAAESNIYDVTTEGVVGMPVVTGLSNARLQYTNIGTAGGNFLVLVNGQDKLQGYDGTDWWIDGDGTHDITGFDTEKAINTNLFKNRLWFTEKTSMRIWYLGLQSIAGAATSIDFSTIFGLGGHLIGMTNWTIDNVSGIDDYAVFITSEGEFAIYKGTDPSTADTWALVGVFRIGRPVGNRPYIKVGSDVLLICDDGLFPLSKALLTDRSSLNLAVSNKITNLINSDVQLYSDNFGWQPILYPIGNKLIVNVPQVENSTQYQYVMNTINGSWCRFTGWNAACFEFFENDLFFGTDGKVVQCDIGTSDNGAAIALADVEQSFSYFGDTGRIKKFNMARPIIACPGILNTAITLNIDFDNSVPTSTPAFSGSSGGATWDVAPWDTSSWGSAVNIIKNWQTVNGVGYAAALRMQVSAMDLTAQWQSTDFVFEPGAVL
jgi:hypothetical protein